MIFNFTMSEAKKLAELLQIGPGSILADVGAGKGDYALALAGQADTVFAVEFQPDRLETIRKKAAARQLANIKLVQSSETSANLPPLSCDAMFLRGVYHHLTKPVEMSASIVASLKPGGKLAIIDFAPKFFMSIFSPVRGVPKNRGGHGIRKEIVIEELTGAGFKLIKEINPWISGRYCLLFAKSIK